VANLVLKPVINLDVGVVRHKSQKIPIITDSINRSIRKLCDLNPEIIFFKNFLLICQIYDGDLAIDAQKELIFFQK